MDNSITNNTEIIDTEIPAVVTLADGNKEAASISSTDKETSEQVISLSLEKIDPFAKHPFQVRNDADMEKLVESIAEYGVLSPIVVRPKADGRFELISGHRRKYASEKAGIKSLPAIVRNLSDAEAIISMTDANLNRERILPSERAFALKMRLEAIKQQGKRTDLTSRPVGAKSGSAAEVGKESGESARQVQRYIRLTNLIKPLLALVDEGKIAFRPAVELSYLTKANQRELVAAIKRECCTPSLSQAVEMKTLAQDGALTGERIAELMKGKKANQVEKITLLPDTLSKYFNKGDTPAAINQTIIKALELYRSRKRSRGDAR